MTATTFRDLLDPWTLFVADDGHPGLRVANPDEILARPVPWVDCPTCKGEGVEFAGDEDDIGDGCPTCSGTGKATVAQLLAWGQAIADPIDSHGLSGDDDYEAVVWYRNRILDVQP